VLDGPDDACAWNIWVKLVNERRNVVTGLPIMVENTRFHGLLKIVTCQVSVLTQYINVGQVKRSVFAGGSVNLLFHCYE